MHEKDIMKRYDYARQKLNEALVIITDIIAVENMNNFSDKYSKECFKIITSDIKDIKGFLAARKFLIDTNKNTEGDNEDEYKK